MADLRPDLDRPGFDRAAELVAEASRIVVMTGAGISTDSGIPDFRGPQGLWTKNPQAERLSTLSDYLTDPAIRRQAWKNRLEHPAWTAQPNPGHLAVAAIQEQDRLVAVMTQNIDELHQRSGVRADRVIELHGSMWKVVCWSCGTETPMAAALNRVRAGNPDPACEVCGGVLKSTTISFGQSLDPLVLARAEAAARACDVMLAVGTTLSVQPAARYVPLAKQCGASVVIVNAQPTACDHLADAVLRGSISEILPVLVSLAAPPTELRG